jgi:hypothetical protein
MHGWNTLLHPGPWSQDQTQRYFTRGQRSRTASSRPHQPPATTSLPTPGERGDEERHSSIIDDVSSSASNTPVRQPDISPKTWYISEMKETLLFKSYDKEMDPKYDAIRDTRQTIYRGCDVSLPSVEDAYARRERREARARRINTE